MMGGEERRHKRNNKSTDYAGIADNKIILIGIGLAILYWILEAVIQVFVFHEGNLIKQIFAPSSHELWMRSLTIFLLIFSSACVQLHINKRKAAEERTAHLNAVLRTIRDVNQLIAREKDRDRLLKGVCEKLIETRGYYNAWIALMDGESGKLVSATQAGLGDEFLQVVDKLKRGEFMNCARMTLAQPGVRVIENPFEACSDCPLASHYKGRSAMTIRLEHGDKVYGILSISIPVQMAVDEEERVLFKEVADDIAFALHDIEIEAARNTAEEKIRESEDRYRSLVESTEDYVYLADIDCRYLFLNEKHLSRFGLPSDKVIGRTYGEFHSPKEEEEFAEKVKEVFETGKSVQHEHRSRRDGNYFLRTLSPVKDPESGMVTAVTVVSKDITRLKHAEERIANLNAVLRTIRDVNQLIARENDRDRLLKGVCEKLIETRGYYNVWIALMDESWNLVSAAQAGLGDEFLKVVDKLNRGEFMNCARMTLAQSGVRVIENPFEACSGCPLASGYEGRSALTIRLEHGGKVYGILTVSVLPEMAKDDEEWVLFKEVADDIAFALHDIEAEAARKQAEEELKNAEERYRATFESTGTVMAILEEDTTISLANKEFERLSGYSKEEIEGKKSWTEFAAPGELERLKKYHYGRRKGVGEEKAPTSYEFKAVVRDGTVIDIYMSVAMIPGTKKSVISMIDITERKRAGEKIRESEEKYRALVESTEDSVYLVDRDCRYLFVNDKHLSRLGLPMDQVVGITYGEFHSPEEEKEFTEIVNQVFETGKSVQHEHRSRRDNRYILRTLSPVKDSEEITTAVTVLSKDISELKRVEREREQLIKELEAKNAEMERFTYTVSHDLRSPLVTLQGVATVLRADLEKDEREKVEKDLEYIGKAATKMDRLLSNTLQLSRIGRVVNPPEDVPFGEIVEEALEQTAEEIKSSGVEVSVTKDFPAVHVDRMRIVEVLVNLIGNSRYYMSEQSHPKIEIGYRVDGENKETVFFVKDNGIGIDESQHEKVFGLFYTVDKSGKGTGAGLAIVKRIIEVHNGRVWIESEKGKGCTVCFTLPVL